MFSGNGYASFKADPVLWPPSIFDHRAFDECTGHSQPLANSRSAAEISRGPHNVRRAKVLHTTGAAAPSTKTACPVRPSRPSRYQNTQGADERLVFVVALFQWEARAMTKAPIPGLFSVAAVAH
jgi:hypothetical protein